MLRELLASFSVDTAQAVGSLQKIDSAIGSAKVKLGSLAEAFIGSALVHGLTGFIEHQIEMGSRVNDLSEKLGISSDELQQFQFAANLSGVEAEGAASALNFFNKNMGMAIEGNKEAVETFTKLGIQIKDGQGNVRELGDVLPEVADSFEKLESSQERTAAAMKIFGKQGAALVPLLKDGAGGLKAMYAEFDRLGGGMSKDFVGAADKAGDEIDKLKFAMNGWKSQIALAVLPTLTKLVTKAQTWVGGLRKVTNETHLAAEAATVLGIAAGAAGLKAAAGFAQFLGVVPKDAGFWKTVLGLGEILLVVAGMAILFLIFEDFFAMLNGDQSIIGSLMDQFLGLGEANTLVNELRLTWAMLSDVFAQDFSDLAPLVDLLKEGAKDVLPYMIAMFVDMVRVVAGLVSMVALLVKGLGQLSQLDFSGVSKTLGAGAGLFKEGGILGSSAVGNLANTQKADVAAPTDVTEAMRAGRRAANDAGGASIGSQSNKIDINITGVKDAAGAGQAAKAGTKEGMAEAMAGAFGAVGTGG